MKSIINMPYLRAKSIDQNTFETKAMDNEQSTLLLSMLLAQRENRILNIVINNDEHFVSLLKSEFREELDMFFFQHAIQKRIDIMELPIRFTLGTMLSIHSFVDRIGSAILLLVDSLECFVKEKNNYLNPAIVDIEDLISMYPYGFYNFDDERFQYWMEHYVKLRYKNEKGNRIYLNSDIRIKWAHVYE